MDFPECSYPVRPCHHNGEPGWQRQDFADYGSFSQVHCHFQEDKIPGEVKCFPQKQMGVINGLSDNIPPLPLYCHSLIVQDDTLGIGQSEEIIKTFDRHIHRLIGNREISRKLNESQTLIQKCRTNPSSTQHWTDLNKTIPTKVKHLFKGHMYMATNSNDNCLMGFNKDFYQGMLCHKQTSESTLLFHAAGNGLRDIYMTTVSQAEESIPHGHQSSKLTLDKPVFQLKCSREGLLFAKQEQQCVVLPYEESERCIHEPTQTFSMNKGEKLSDIGISPYVKSEILVSSTSGEVYLWNLDSGARTSFQKIPKSDIMTPWTSCHFAGHPRQIVVSDHYSMDLFDHRDNFGKGLELFHLSELLVKNQERLMVTSELEFPYHLVATDFALFVVDQRFPGSPVLQWSTESLNVPQYLKVCKLLDVGEDVNGSQSEYFIFLGTQQPGEVFCFSLHLAKGFAPTTKTLPWRVGKIGDFVENKKSLFISKWRDIENHYQSPLAGMTVVGHSDERKRTISVYQMDGYGDLYFQDFQLTPESEASGCYTLAQPSEVAKAAADCRAKDFLSSLIRTDDLDDVSIPTSSKSKEKYLAHSDIESIMTNVEPVPSTSKESLQDRGMTYAEFVNLACNNYKLKWKIVNMECLRKSGANTRLLLALRKNEDISEVLVEREEDYEKKKQRLREEYTQYKERMKIKCRKLAKKRVKNNIKLK